MSSTSDESAISKWADSVSGFVCVYLGLFVGKEGPMIHSGAIVGAGLPQVQRHTSWTQLIWNNTHERKSFDIKKNQTFISALSIKAKYCSSHNKLSIGLHMAWPITDPFKDNVKFNKVIAVNLCHLHRSEKSTFVTWKLILIYKIDQRESSIEPCGTCHQNNVKSFCFLVMKTP